ncbi:hypothetical protein VKT23_017859 [Stygiomarasmius scandens]|uniref:Chromatin elongation factor SPT5 n=1 Tax=Marasmiellus scandens TaxID=2682957 RepID=A0ABR1ITQ1_9AGAR
MRQFAESLTLSVDDAVNELTWILGQSPLPQLWRTAVDKAITEPDEDSSAGVVRLNEILPLLMALDTSHPISSPTKYTRSEPITLGEYRVLSAFVAPTVAGSVYLEAHLGRNPQNSDIVEFLRGHPACIKTGSLRKGQTKPRVWLEPISSLDIAALLSSIPVQSNIKPGSWVRVTKGPYTDDIGLVLLLLVPRLPPPPTLPPPPERPSHPKHPLNRDDNLLTRHPLPPTTPTSGDKPSTQHPLPPITSTPNLAQPRKRKHTREQYLQGLFDHLVSTRKCEDLGGGCFRARREEFEHGLLVGKFSYNVVSRVDISMDSTTQRFFKNSAHPILKDVHFPVSSNWRFFVNDRVEVIQSAPLTVSNIIHPECPHSETYLKDSIIHSVEQNCCLVQFKEYAELDVQDTQVWVRSINLHKMFMIGDLVAVEAGENQGQTGLVLTSYGDEIVVAETGHRQGQSFWVEPNVCRLTKVIQEALVPWIDRHVTICGGQYNQYTGLVVDVLPPRPNYTMLDIVVLRLMQTVRVRHNDVLDTCSNKTLQQMLPLGANQRYFKQVSWDSSFAPNLKSPPVDPHTNQVLKPEDAISRQPDQPWIGVEVMVIKGALKQCGTLKAVERSYHFPSRLRVLIELHYVSAEHGAVPQKYFDYEAIRDPLTGLPLHARYPLRQRQRYWEPLTRVKAVSVSNPKITQPSSLSQSGLSTPPWNNTEFLDPFQTPGAGSSASPSHWALDPRLDGKEFFVCWKPTDQDGLAKVIAKPDCKHQRVRLMHGLEKWFVLPQEIDDLALPIKPKSNKEPLVVVRGEHTGKHIQHIFYTYVDGEKEPLITAPGAFFLVQKI